MSHDAPPTEWHNLIAAFHATADIAKVTHPEMHKQIAGLGGEVGNVQQALAKTTKVAADHSADVHDAIDRIIRRIAKTSDIRRILAISSMLHKGLDTGSDRDQKSGSTLKQLYVSDIC